MAEVTRTIRTAAEQVYAILADGWTYSDWVVGTAHIRDVDASWPEPGTRLHHKVGPWPLSINDTSTVIALKPGRELTLRARIWPLGEAVVHITLEPINPGETRVTMYEEFQEGPLHWFNNKITDLALHGRNAEALLRLAELAEHSRHTAHSPR
ncbi:SRPBCC family protein [Actinoplanes regularis]|uniref:SRPBCC family protein n=1 Tax=Actinoplanes regularis TaxID=52697 RepID=UPI0024A278A9|nr:SRPBCC family protein [Actinoplanes regularis]GLW29358.1 polyketide cyclase [Actinoplanes regularis]